MNQAVSQEKASLVTLALDIVKPDPNQPRKAFDDAQLEELAASIRVDGVLQPIVVRPNGGDAFYIVDGERRYRAAAKAGLSSIAAIVRDDLKGRDVSSLQLVANIQRADLTLAEQCDAVGALVKSVGFEPACKQLGMSAGWVSKRANAQSLPEPVKKLIRTGHIADIEIAGGLGELHKLDNKRAELLTSRLAKDLDGYTRGDIANEVRVAKDDRAHQEQMRQRAATEKKAGATKDGKSPSADPAEIKAKERQRAIDKAKDDRKNLRTSSLTAIYAGLKIDAKKQDAFNAPVAIDYGADFPGTFDTSGKFPTTAEACQFTLHAHGDVGHLKRVAAGFKRQPTVDVVLPAMSLDQALAVERAIKDLKGCQFSIEERLLGKDLIELTSRLNPKAKPAAAAKARGNK